jgi:DNA-binding response OmpR family regulator
MRILVIEDDLKIAGFIRSGLEGEGFAVELAADGEVGLDRALHGGYDLVILDLMLPKLDGFEVLRRMREAGVQSYVLVLSARGGVDDRVRGLDIGADEYFVKPFSFVELLARVRAMLRRKQTKENTISVAPFRLDLHERAVTRDGKTVELTPREFQLFLLFMENPDQVLSRAMLAERVWGYHFDTGTNVIDVYVNYLRRKLGHSGEKFLVAVRGVGYVFRPANCVIEGV